MKKEPKLEQYENLKDKKMYELLMAENKVDDLKRHLRFIQHMITVLEVDREAISLADKESVKT